MELPVAKWLGFNSELLKEISIRTVCLPSSCSASNMELYLKQLLKRLLGVSDVTNLFSISKSSCRTKDKAPWDGLTIFTVVLLSVFGATVILCTLYDYFLCPEQEKLPRPIRAFSARATSRSLFTIVENSANPNVIHCLNGMRCMSLIWVFFSHEYIGNMKGPSMNPVDNLIWASQLFSSFILYGTLSVDTFFFIAGLLLVSIGLRSMEKNKGKLNVPLMYLHRYLRLTPVVALAILFFYKMIPLFADGPMYDDIGFFEYSACKKTWYWTLLYVQNYATSDVLSPLAVWAGWLLSLALLFTSIFALYPYSKLLGKSPTILEGALYYTLVRIAWPLGLCWVVFACMQGYGSLANSFLSSPLWQPLSKLSYGAYMWHIFVMEVANRSVQTNTYFSNYQMMLNFWSTFGFTLLVTYVLYVLIEAPLEALERMMFPNRRQIIK
ncbi:GM22967 [Drosophila sechellia]|uniref:GM22967 n=1 Tax=Drosophila sechellia TaxID=7238 RepID=B4I772_DROSE|nr:GM22967 [Drosophila sechellia]